MFRTQGDVRLGFHGVSGEHLQPVALHDHDGDEAGFQHGEFVADAEAGAGSEGDVGLGKAVLGGFGGSGRGMVLLV